MSSRRCRYSLALSVLVLCAGLACKQKTPEVKAYQPYTPVEGSVGFDLLRMGGSDGAQEWLATYTDGDRASKFRIELDAPTSGDAGADSTGQGKLIAESDSDSLLLLEKLKKVLQAKQMPRKIVSAESLPFDYVVVAKSQSRSADGKLSSSPAGDWSTLKLMPGKGHGEVVLNLNVLAHQAEFVGSDPKNGDLLLAEFAKVL